jgi:ATP-dependent RNA circularization protein (DNA/RNA ligase family)
VTGITYTVTKDGFGCPFSTTKLPETKTGASYTQHKPITFAATNGATIDVG